MARSPSPGAPPEPWARPACDDDAPLLLVNAHYHPDVAATAHHLTDLAEYLIAAGYRVEVCTARGRYVAGRMAVPTREVRNGVEIHRVPGTTFGRGRLLGRIADYASFHLQALLRVLGGRRYRGVIVLTTPPLLSVVGWLGRRLRGRRYAIWSMDLHPEAEIAAGMLRPSSLLGRVLVGVNGAGYRGADFVIALGSHMRERILRQGVRPARLATVPVWVDRDEVAPLPRDENPLVAELGLAGKFVVAYVGNAGIAHDFADVLAAMRRLRDHPRVHFLFVGDGPQRAAIEAYAREHRIENFRYHDYFPRERIRHVYGLADVHLVTLRAAFAGIAVPTKCYVSMATAQPVLFVGPARCESADAIRAADGGVVIDPAEGAAADRIVAQLTAWSEAPATVRALGSRARDAVLRGYEREANCAALERVIREHWGAPVIHQREHTA